MSITTLFHPEEFQGRGKQRSYFEGWYFKVLNKAETHAFAFIPGIALDKAGNRHSFIQVLDGKKNLAFYHTFDIHSFTAEKGVFNVAIGKNHFSRNAIQLDIPDISGHLEFTNTIAWPSPWYSPGIMGPFTFVPFMECRHGIVSMDHGVSGELVVQGEHIDFNGGRGYIEKDWGHSFPSAYVWLQSNHFSIPGISIKVSVANIPWLGKSFVGFIAGVWLHDHLIRFTTYNRSSLRMLNIYSDKIELALENMTYSLKIVVVRATATSLASPIRGFMEGRIEESMSSISEVTLYNKKSGALILHDRGRNTALEVAGKIDEIITHSTPSEP